MALSLTDLAGALPSDFLLLVGARLGQQRHPGRDARLLLRTRQQAEEGLEQVVTSQGLVTVVGLTVAAGPQVRRPGLGVVPPEFVRHAAKEDEGFDQTVAEALGALGGKGQSERAARVSPSDEEGREERGTWGKSTSMGPKSASRRWPESWRRAPKARKRWLRKGRT